MVQTLLHQWLLLVLLDESSVVLRFSGATRLLQMVMLLCRVEVGGDGAGARRWGPAADHGAVEALSDHFVLSGLVLQLI